MDAQDHLQFFPSYSYCCFSLCLYLSTARVVQTEAANLGQPWIILRQQAHRNVFAPQPCDAPSTLPKWQRYYLACIGPKQLIKMGYTSLDQSIDWRTRRLRASASEGAISGSARGSSELHSAAKSFGNSIRAHLEGATSRWLDIAGWLDCLRYVSAVNLSTLGSLSLSLSLLSIAGAKKMKSMKKGALSHGGS